MATVLLNALDADQYNLYAVLRYYLKDKVGVKLDYGRLIHLPYSIAIPMLTQELYEHTGLDLHVHMRDDVDCRILNWVNWANDDRVHRDLINLLHDIASWPSVAYWVNLDTNEVMMYRTEDNHLSTDTSATMRTVYPSEPIEFNAGDIEHLQLVVYDYPPTSLDHTPLAFGLHLEPSDQPRHAYQPLTAYLVANGIVFTFNVHGPDHYTLHSVTLAHKNARALAQTWKTLFDDYPSILANPTFVDEAGNTVYTVKGKVRKSERDSFFSYSLMRSINARYALNSTRGLYLTHPVRIPGEVFKQAVYTYFAHQDTKLPPPGTTLADFVRATQEGLRRHRSGEAYIAMHVEGDEVCITQWVIGHGARMPGLLDYNQDLISQAYFAYFDTDGIRVYPLHAADRTTLERRFFALRASGSVPYHMGSHYLNNAGVSYTIYRLLTIGPIALCYQTNDNGETDLRIELNELDSNALETALVDYLLGPDDDYTNLCNMLTAQ